VAPPTTTPPGPASTARDDQPVEVVTATTPRPLRATLLTQWWRDAAFLHWPVDADVVAPLMPPGVRPDVHDETSWVGLIGFRMVALGFGPLPGVPYFGSFLETNVRLYSVDRLGRRGVVFRTLDATRLVPVLASRVWPQVPYAWSSMEVDRDGRPATGTAPLAVGEHLTYTARRRWPAPRGTTSRFAVRVGDAVTEPSPLESFLTARWGLHSATRAGGTRYLPNAHPAWPLHRATVTELDDGLVVACGLPQPVGPPASVLVSDGVSVRFGPPLTDAPLR